MFSDPYRVSTFNRWTSPYLDDDARAVREDSALKLEIAELKSMYVFGYHFPEDFHYKSTSKPLCIHSVC